MKTYDEMARYVLEVRDEHERKRKKRITFIKRSVPAAIAVMGAFIIGFGIWKGYKRPEQLPSPDNIINNTSVTTTLPHASETALITTTTNKTVISSETSETSVSASTQTTKISQTTAEASVTTAVSAEESSEASTVTALSTTKAATTSSAAAKTTSSTSQPVPHAIITTTIACSELSGDPSTGTGAGGALPSGGTEGSGGSQTVGGGAASPSTEGNGGGGIYDPWYGLPIYQQFTNAYVSGYTKTYTSGCVISDRYVGDMIGSVNMESGQPVEGFIKQCTAEAFHINGIDAESAIAVKFYGHNEYYLYHTRDTDIYDIMKQIT